MHVGVDAASWDAHVRKVQEAVAKDSNKNPPDAAQSVAPTEAPALRDNGDWC